MDDILDEIKQNIKDVTVLDLVDWKKTAKHNFENVHIKDAIMKMSQTNKSKTWDEYTSAEKKQLVNTVEKYFNDLFKHLIMETKKFNG